MTAGEDKGLLDPFLPVEATQQAHVQGLLDEIHRQFIEAVQSGRGDRLKDDPKIFSGLIWTGEQGVELGLVDAIASSGQVARDVIGAEKIVNFTPKQRFWENLFGWFVSALADTLGMHSPIELR